METVIRFKDNAGAYKGYIVSSEHNAVAASLIDQICEIVWDYLDETAREELERIEKAWNRAEISYHSSENFRTSKCFEVLKNGDPIKNMGNVHKSICINGGIRR
jgi:uncharacterized UBP type Zn finger protein